MAEEPQDPPEERKEEDGQDDTSGFSAQDNKSEEKEDEEMEENDLSANEYQGQSVHGIDNVSRVNRPRVRPGRVRTTSNRVTILAPQLQNNLKVMKVIVHQRSLTDHPNRTTKRSVIYFHNMAAVLNKMPFGRIIDICFVLH
ncbi:uncharacterized protein LOC117318950 [Pecten maximus]|uniref:uncharacterized protein LOC117318950 n=1 Tax=Pecten maximus TaxID=6579 RepID=UPI00145822BC|nr:uncharacterized protein LOC117318950 [Pecten maximus]